MRRRILIVPEFGSGALHNKDTLLHSIHSMR